MALDYIPTGWYVVAMRHTMLRATDKQDAKAKLLPAAIKVVRAKGYTATSVGDLCREAGVTKGAFFHHFRSKDDLAVAAANYWSEVTGALFANAGYHNREDPLDRVLGYIDFRRELIQGDAAEFTCLVGTMVQEIYGDKPQIRAACEASIFGHAEVLEADIAEAMRKYRVKGDWIPKSLALFTQTVLQGAFVLAKAKGDAKVALDSIDHLYRYVELLFYAGKTTRARTPDIQGLPIPGA